MRWLLNEQYRKVGKLEEENETLKEENRRLLEKNKIYSNALIKEKEEKQKLKEEYDNFGKTIYTQDVREIKEENKKLKEFLNITVQTKNEKIRNLLEELEYYKKQCGED